MKFLHIGGPADGKRVELEDECAYHDVITTKGFDADKLFDEATSDEAVTMTIRYTRREFKMRKNAISIFTLESMSFDQTLTKLIENYRPR